MFAPAPARWAQQGSQSRAPCAQAGMLLPGGGWRAAGLLPALMGRSRELLASCCAVPTAGILQQMGHVCVPVWWPRVAGVERAVVLLPQSAGRVSVRACMSVWAGCGAGVHANQSVAQVRTCTVGMLLAATDRLAQACAGPPRHGVKVQGKHGLVCLWEGALREACCRFSIGQLMDAAAESLPASVLVPEGCPDICRNQHVVQ